MTGYRVGVDIGGTFTDIVLLGSDGTVHTKKISSSVGDYARDHGPMYAGALATSRRRWKLAFAAALSNAVPS